MASYPLTAADNPNWIFTRDGNGNATQIDMVVAGPRGSEVTYRLTLAWTGDDLDTVSKWVQQ